MSSKLQDLCPKCEQVVHNDRFRDAIATCADKNCETTLHKCGVCSAVNLSYARFCRVCQRELDPFHEKLERWGKGAGSGLEGLGLKSHKRHHAISDRLSPSARLIFIGGQLWLLDGLVTARPAHGMPDPFSELPQQKLVVRYFGEESDDDFTRWRDLLPSLQLDQDETLWGSPTVAGHELLFSTSKRLLAWPLTNLGRHGIQLQPPAVWTPTEGRRIVGDPLGLSRDEIVVATSDINKGVNLHMLRLEGEGHKRRLVEKQGNCQVQDCDPARVFLSQTNGDRAGTQEVFLASTYQIFRYKINAGQLLPQAAITINEMRPTGPVFCSFHMIFFDADVPDKKDPDGDWICAVVSGFLQEGQQVQFGVYPGSEEIIRSYWNSGSGGQKLFLVGHYDLRLYPKLRHDSPKVRDQRAPAAACCQLGPLVAVARGGGLTDARYSVELINFQHSVDPLGNLLHTPLEGNIGSPGALCITPDRLFAIVDRGDYGENFELVEIPFDLSGNRRV